MLYWCGPRGSAFTKGALSWTQWWCHILLCHHEEFEWATRWKWTNLIMYVAAHHSPFSAYTVLKIHHWLIGCRGWESGWCSTCASTCVGAVCGLHVCQNVPTVLYSGPVFQHYILRLYTVLSAWCTCQCCVGLLVVKQTTLWEREVSKGPKCCTAYVRVPCAQS